jgi:adenosine deaminase
MPIDQNGDALVDGVSLRSLPKVSLHDHLDGAVRPQTIIDLADEAGIEVASQDAGELADWFAEKSDSGSLVEYLKTFDLTTGVMQTTEGLTRIAREFVEDLVADGVVYGEVRWAPEQHLTRGLSLEEAVEAVQEGIEQGEDAAEDAGHDIRVGQLISAMRHTDRSLEIARLAVDWRGRGAVGFDIAGPEDGFPPSRLRPAFDYLAENFFPTTVPARPPASTPSARRCSTAGRCASATGCASPKTCRSSRAKAKRSSSSSETSPGGCATARSRSSCRRRRTCRPAPSRRGAPRWPTTRSTCCTSSGSR